LAGTLVKAPLTSLRNRGIGSAIDDRSPAVAIDRFSDVSSSDDPPADCAPRIAI
jgi:hypothetical protein